MWAVKPGRIINDESEGTTGDKSPLVGYSDLSMGRVCDRVMVFCQRGQNMVRCDR